MGLNGPRPVWPTLACQSPISSAGRLVGRPQPHVLPPACEGSGDGNALPGPHQSQLWIRAAACLPASRSRGLGPSQRFRS